MSTAPWNHDAVACCSCTALPYVHAHCPCQSCNGKAVARSTELRHRKEAKLISNCSTHVQVEDTIADHLESTNESNMVTNEDNIENINESRMDFNGINDNDIASTIDITDHESQSSNNVSNSAESQINATASPITDLQKDVLIAVLRTFELMEEANASQKSFMNILNFGRDMYCKGDHNMIRDWPSSWSGCLALLKKNGYKEPVAYYICLNAMHPNQWSILDNSADVCKFAINQAPYSITI